jgi:glycerol-3-phosphate dehydrogenase (NAD(P)+)
MIVGILGSGPWGRALATLAAEAGNEPRIGYQGKPPRGFKGTPNLSALAREVELLLVAAEPEDVREVVRVAQPGPGNRVVIAARGLEPDSGKWLSSVITEESRALRVGALAGPALASEILARRPSALVAASAYDEVSALVQDALHSSICRVYTSNDLRGVETAGAIVRVLAVALGVADGLGLGVGVRGVVVTRGLAEARRLGAALGADEATFSGLAGVGDLVACGNHPEHPGYLAGRDIVQKPGRRDGVMRDARGMLALAARNGVTLPLTEAVAAIAAGRLQPRQAIDMLMRREATSE